MKKTTLFTAGMAALLTAAVMVTLAGCPTEGGGGGFVAVSGISGIPAWKDKGAALTLNGTVTPSNATNQAITWKVKTIGTTGALITSGSNTLTTNAAGTVIITATIAGGATETTAYTQDFTILSAAEVKTASDTASLTTALNGLTAPADAPAVITLTGSKASIIDTWETIHTTINGGGKYVYLDLSAVSGVTTVTGKSSPSGNDMNIIKDNTYIKGIVLPNGLTSIGSSAFYNCKSLTSITIPNGVTSIEGYAFAGCTSLTSVTIPNGVTSIEGNAFQSCTSLTSVTIPNSVTTIGNSAFYVCNGLTSITVGAGNAAYMSENGVLFNKAKTTLIQYPVGKTDTSYSIPGNVASIGNDAFYNCTSLTSVTIPTSVTSIEGVAFQGCTGLTGITVDTGNTAYTSVNGVLFNKAKSILMQYPEGKTDASYTIPDGVTSIGVYAFSNCTSLTSVTISNSVTSIGNGAFWGSAGLTSVTIPNNVLSIENNAFIYCSQLTSVTFAGGSVNIGNRAFPPSGSENALETAYASGKAGTYTLSGSTWSKQTS